MPSPNPLDLLPPWSGTIPMGSDPEELEAALAVHLGHVHASTTSFPVRKLTLEAVADACDELLASTSNLRGTCFDALVRHEGALARLEVQGSHVDCTIRAADPDAARSVAQYLSDTFRDEWTPHEGTVVNVTVWMNSPHGPQPMPLRIEAPTWEEIAPNYPSAVRAGLGRMMESRRGQVDGIALWRGEPGTGKTTALRALAWEWRDWCDVHVIIDPEVFLGDQASYMVNMLMMTEQFLPGMMMGMGPDEFDEAGPMAAPLFLRGAADDDDDDDDDDYYERSRRRAGMTRARLIVLEDAGELVKADARVAAGQALSRLLNLSDGIIGQGTNASVLVTTNEELGQLHPAVARPGRCWAHVEFDQFPEADANAWLDAHGVERRASGPMTVAELYGWKRGDGIVQIGSLRDDM